MSARYTMEDLMTSRYEDGQRDILAAIEAAIKKGIALITAIKQLKAKTSGQGVESLNLDGK